MTKTKPSVIYVYPEMRDQSDIYSWGFLVNPTAQELAERHDVRLANETEHTFITFICTNRNAIKTSEEHADIAAAISNMPLLSDAYVSKSPLSDPATPWVYWEDRNAFAFFIDADKRSGYTDMRKATPAECFFISVLDIYNRRRGERVVTILENAMNRGTPSLN